MLLILDNFEQLLAGVALIDQILKACPELSLLVTSRQPLNLVSEPLPAARTRLSRFIDGR